MAEKSSIKCPSCSSNNIVKAGKKRLKRQTVQRYICRSCSKYFSDKQLKHKTYNSKIILNSINIYNLGFTLEQTKNTIAKKFKTPVPITTIQSWIKEYSGICTFARLRKQAINLYKPEDIIFQQTLNHIQPYTFKCHKAKMDILIKENPQFSAIKNYIEKINSKEFPHHIFTYSNECNHNEKRASQIKFEHLEVKQIQKSNSACKLASLALNLATTNKERHQKIQDFFLTNDSTTIAVEVPIYLTNWDAGYYRNQKGFIFPLNNYTTPITGHIDLLQIRNGLIHIIDYKPEADKINATEQLTIYSMALSRKLNLPLHHFKAAWFDENNYFEFFPLHAVYEKNL